MKPLVLIGGGGHARSVAAMLEGSRPIAGYTDMTPTGLDMPYLGTDSCLDPASSDYETLVTVGFGAGASLGARSAIFNHFPATACEPVIAPSAWVSRSAGIGRGTAVMARATVNACSIGANAVINTGAIIEHDCTIEDNCFIGPGAIVCGGAFIGACTFIGAGAIIREGVSIAAGTTIGMGTVVTATIEEPGTYVGNPARKINKKS